jgi:hypothetical protein
MGDPYNYDTYNYDFYDDYFSERDDKSSLFDSNDYGSERDCGSFHNDSERDDESYDQEEYIETLISSYNRD